MKLTNFDLSEKNTKIIFASIIILTSLGFMIDSEFLQKTWIFNGTEVIDNCEEYGHIKIWNYCGDHISLLENYDVENILDSVHDGDTFFYNLSKKTFDNYLVFSFISSILLLVVSYLLTVKIVGKRYSGLIVMILIIQSAIYYKYALGVTYPFHWALFYLTSIYMCYRIPLLSPVFFILSVWAKPITIMYLPINFVFIYLTSPKGYKFVNMNFVIFCLITVSSIVWLFTKIHIELFSFNQNEFEMILATWTVLFISDLLNLCLLFASMVGLVLLRKEQNSKLFLFIFLIMIGGIIVVDTFIPVGNDNEEYRMIVFLVFIAIATSYVITKLEKLYEIIKK
ncbi:hypothetical protein QIT55_gp20 [Nitrosopumilus spindle-shaped virus]|uniref:Uncharacterized protein n=1 Tax=Nitrosopumilus spindle-shaped virus 1 TaxID=2848002 RepID=A0A514K300_9VIRU|nr:hypothetical protein QIT55_gp20 [Nitrosopumilus spindle-shaped virus]QDI74006.1 hypothetical protein [Nitrosopumilus spindle-shaped virus]